MEKAKVVQTYQLDRARGKNKVQIIADLRALNVDIYQLVEEQNFVPILHAAVKIGCQPLVDALLEYAFEKIENENEYTLERAKTKDWSINKNDDEIHAQIKKIKRLNWLKWLNYQVNDSGITAIQIACEKGLFHPKEKCILKTLLEESADPSIKDHYGRNTLHHAVMGGNYEVIAYLLGKYPQMLYVADNYGYTPLLLCLALPDKARYNRQAVFDLLLKSYKHLLLPIEKLLPAAENHPEPSLRNPGGTTAVHLAVKARFPDIAIAKKDGEKAHFLATPLRELLTKCIPDPEKDNSFVNAQDELGKTAAHYALGDTTALRVLAEFKAGVDIKDRSGHTTRAIVTKRGHKRGSSSDALRIVEGEETQESEERAEKSIPKHGSTNNLLALEVAQADFNRVEQEDRASNAENVVGSSSSDVVASRVKDRSRRQAMLLKNVDFSKGVPKKPEREPPSPKSLSIAASSAAAATPAASPKSSPAAAAAASSQSYSTALYTAERVNSTSAAAISSASSSSSSVSSSATSKLTAQPAISRSPAPSAVVATSVSTATGTGIATGPLPLPTHAQRHQSEKTGDKKVQARAALNLSRSESTPPAPISRAGDDKTQSGEILGRNLDAKRTLTAPTPSLSVSRDGKAPRLNKEQIKALGDNFAQKQQQFGKGSLIPSLMHLIKMAGDCPIDVKLTNGKVQIFTEDLILMLQSFPEEMRHQNAEYIRDQIYYVPNLLGLIQALCSIEVQKDKEQYGREKSNKNPTLLRGNDVVWALVLAFMRLDQMLVKKKGAYFLVHFYEKIRKIKDPKKKYLRFLELLQRKLNDPIDPFPIMQRFILGVLYNQLVESKIAPADAFSKVMAFYYLRFVGPFIEGPYYNKVNEYNVRLQAKQKEKENADKKKDKKDKKLVNPYQKAANKAHEFVRDLSHSISKLHESRDPDVCAKWEDFCNNLFKATKFNLLELQTSEFLRVYKKVPPGIVLLPDLQGDDTTRLLKELDATVERILLQTQTSTPSGLEPISTPSSARSDSSGSQPYSASSDLSSSLDDLSSLLEGDLSIYSGLTSPASSPPTSPLTSPARHRPTSSSISDDESGGEFETATPSDSDPEARLGSDQDLSILGDSGNRRARIGKEREGRKDSVSSTVAGSAAALSSGSSRAVSPPPASPLPKAPSTSSSASGGAATSAGGSSHTAHRRNRSKAEEELDNALADLNNTPPPVYAQTATSGSTSSSYSVAMGVAPAISSGSAAVSASATATASSSSSSSASHSVRKSPGSRDLPSDYSESSDQSLGPDEADPAVGGSSSSSASPVLPASAAASSNAGSQSSSRGRVIFRKIKPAEGGSAVPGQERVRAFDAASLSAGRSSSSASDGVSHLSTTPPLSNVAGGAQAALSDQSLASGVAASLPSGRPLSPPPLIPPPSVNAAPPILSAVPAVAGGVGNTPARGQSVAAAVSPTRQRPSSPLPPHLRPVCNHQWQQLRLQPRALWLMLKPKLHQRRLRLLLEPGSSPDEDLLLLEHIQQKEQQ